MKVTAQDLIQFKVIDAIIPEPLGGAHRDVARAITDTGDAIEANLRELDRLGADELKRQRREKFLAIGRIQAAV